MSRSHSSFIGVADGAAGHDAASTAHGPTSGRTSSWRASTQLFPTIRLTKEEQIHYDVTVSRVLERTLKEYESFNGQVNKDNWALVRKRKQMSVYRNLQGIGNPRVTLMMGTGLIPGTVDEVMDGLYCDTTEELRAVKALIKYKFLDGGVFHVCESRAPEAPYRFAGIKWFAAKTPFGGSIVKSRDLLTYERMGVTADVNGNEIAFHVLQSINRPEWPADCIKNIRRAYTSSCYLYRRRNNVVECFLWGEFYANGLMAQRLADYGVAGIWMNVVRTPQAAEAKKLTQLMMRATSGTVSASGSCHNCHQRPGYFDKLRPCAGCRQRVCKNCASRRAICKFDWHAKRILTEEFCLLCVTEVTNLPVSVLKHHQSAGTAHSVSSMSENQYENAQYVHQAPYTQQQQHHHHRHRDGLEQYEGHEQLGKPHYGDEELPPPSYYRNTVMSSTFTQSSMGGRPSQYQPQARSTIHEEPFALTEANLRSFEFGINGDGAMAVEEKLEIVQSAGGDAPSSDFAAMDASDVLQQQQARYAADSYAPVEFDAEDRTMTLPARSRQPGRASV